MKQKILRYECKKSDLVVQLCVLWTSLPALSIDLSIKSGFLPQRWVFIMVQCCKITGFPQCFLLFVRSAMETWSGSISETQGFPAEESMTSPASAPRHFCGCFQTVAHKNFIVGSKKSQLRGGGRRKMKTGAMFKDMHERQKVHTAGFWRHRDH